MHVVDAPLPADLSSFHFLMKIWQATMNKRPARHWKCKFINDTVQFASGSFEYCGGAGKIPLDICVTIDLMISIRMQNNSHRIICSEWKYIIVARIVIIVWLIRVFYCGSETFADLSDTIWIMMI